MEDDTGSKDGNKERFTGRYWDPNLPGAGEEFSGSLLSLDKVLEYSELSQAELYAAIETRQFPKPIEIVSRVHVWHPSDFWDWFLQVASRYREMRIPDFKVND